MNNPRQPIFVHAESEEQFWLLAKTDLLHILQESIKKRGQAWLGLAGGSTPKKLYENLAEQKLPWEKIHLVILDERYVPSDHSESNEGMLRETLLKKVPIPPQNVLSFDTSFNLFTSAEEMNRKLTLLFQKGLLFDLLILGAGKDGHIASLFEGDSALESASYATVAHAQGYPTENRLTLTLHALRSSRRVLLLLKGKDKKPVFDSLSSPEGPLALTALKQVIERVPTRVLMLL